LSSVLTHTLELAPRPEALLTEPLPLHLLDADSVDLDVVLVETHPVICRLGHPNIFWPSWPEALLADWRHRLPLPHRQQGVAISHNFGQHPHRHTIVM
jgi:hypothetical protein